MTFVYIYMLISFNVILFSNIHMIQIFLKLFIGMYSIEKIIFELNK